MDTRAHEAVVGVTGDGGGVVAAVEEVGQVDALARAENVRVVGRRADADCLGCPPEHVAQLVRQPLQRVRRVPSRRASEYLVQEHCVVRRPGGTCVRETRQ